MMGKCNCGIVPTISIILVAIGAINWGLVGIGYFAGGNWNVVNLILGSWPAVEAVVYILVGLAAIASLWHTKSCKDCQAGGM